jgi:ZIP family zinc transporter
MFAAFAWGFAAAFSLVIGGAISLVRPINRKLLGLTMAFGSGVLISAVAYDLVLEGFHVAADPVAIALGLAGGALTFYLGDLAIDRLGGENRTRAEGMDQADSPLAIVLGIILDGIPESIVIGLTLLGGQTIDLAVVIAVFLSNIPESVSATVGLKETGWRPARILGLWLLVSLVSGAASWFGFTVFGGLDPSAVALVDAFAAGAILTMLTDTMIPQGFQLGGRQAGLAVTLGFGLAFGLTILP